MFAHVPQLNMLSRTVDIPIPPALCYL